MRAHTHTNTHTGTTFTQVHTRTTHTLTYTQHTHSHTHHTHTPISAAPPPGGNKSAGASLASWRTRRGVALDITCLPGVEMLGARVRCVILCVPVDVHACARPCYAVWHYMHAWGEAARGTCALCVFVCACRCRRPC